MRASQVHELDLGPKDKQGGLVGKSLFKQEFKQVKKDSKYTSGCRKDRARILFNIQAEEDQSTTRTINTNFKSVTFSLLQSQSPRAAHT